MWSLLSSRPDEACGARRREAEAGEGRAEARPYTAENFGDDAGSAEDIGEVFLQEAVLVHEELEDFERLGAGKLVVAVFEILDQEGQELGKLLFGGGELLAAAVQLIKKLGAGFVFLLGANHAGREFLEKLDVFRAGRESAHSFHPSLLYSAWVKNRFEERAGQAPPLHKRGWTDSYLQGYL